MAGFNFNVGSGGGAAGGAASKGCGGGCGAIFGVILGLVLIPVGFYLAYHAEAKLVDHGKIFAGITMSEPDAAKSSEGELVKIQGQPQGTFLALDEWDGQALYFSERIEEYEKETDSDGNVDYEWNTETSDSDWVETFSLGPVEIRPKGANPVGEEEVYSAYKKKFETDFHVGTEAGSPEVGDQRKSIEVLDASKATIVVGKMTSGTIQGGESFVVSTQNESQTLETLKTEYKFAKWGMRAGAVFCIFFGIMAIFGPLTTLVGYIPLIGDQISCAFAGIAFVFALVSVTIVTLFIKAFWFLVAIVALGIAFLIYRGVKSPREGPGSGPDGAGGGPEQPAPPTQPTPAAGEDDSQAGTSATLPPGAGAGVPRPTSAPEPTEPGEDVGPAPPPETPAEREAGPETPEPEEASEVPDADEGGTAFLRPPAARDEQEDTESGPKFCPNCGEKLEPGSKFCPSCGEPVNRS